MLAVKWGEDAYFGRQKEMRRTIDPSLGLHLLARRGSFRFQLGYAKEQTEEILSNLDDLVRNTTKTAPMRTKDLLKSYDESSAHKRGR